MAVLVVPAPGHPDAGAEEKGPEKVETLFEAGDGGLPVFELKVNLIQPVAGNFESYGSLVAVLGEDEEIVRVTNQLQPGLLQCKIEIGKEEVGQQRGYRTALRNPDLDGMGTMSVPAKAADPSIEKIAERCLGQARPDPLAKQTMIDAVEEGIDVGLGDVFEAVIVQEPNAGDGRVDRAVGAECEAAIEELVFKGAPEVPPHGGLEDAVAYGGHQERARGRGARFFLNDDRQEGEGTVFPSFHARHERLQLSIESSGEPLDGDAIDTRATVVFEDPLPPFEQTFGCQPLDGHRSAPSELERDHSRVILQTTC